VAFYNDSKATNTDATIKALESFSGGIILILGGRDKGSDYTVLRALVSTRVKALVLLGEACEKIRLHLAATAPMFQAADMEDAVKVAYQQASAGNKVLLAPACASFDMFRNYEHRGQVFKEAVMRLKQDKERTQS
jgi:UDP-N-acetylmuramoylalanine--D-glutamate ligase